MKDFGPVVFLRIPLVLAAILVGFPAVASAQSFTIKATDVVMPANGGAVSQITLTSIDGYAGTIYVGCQYAGPPTTAKLPICSGYTMVNNFVLPADQTLTISRAFYPYGAVIPVRQPLTPLGKNHLPLAAMVFVGALVIGRGLRRMNSIWFAFALLAGIALAGISGCTGPMSQGASGTYTYSIVGTDTKTNATVSTTINVTVP